ncbi:MAG: type II toxin-antitoxin system RelE/ParE family toxin [Planctomycetales bacterium]|nr:type II toxin-antitoxin system RelE/ParE family toxin [Planctomycetales bacterium]
MTVEVRLDPAAEAQADTVDLWWRANRRIAPDLFSEELARAMALLSQVPRAGRLYRRRGIPGLRRLLLPATRYHAYYVHRPEEGDVVLLAVWSAVRGQGPPLAPPS